MQIYCSQHPDVRLAKGHLDCLLFPICSGAESTIDCGAVEGQLSDPLVRVLGKISDFGVPKLWK